MTELSVENTLVPLGNKKVKHKLAAIKEFIELHKKQTFYICCHDNPDPDAIASAWGMLRVVNFLGAENAHIVYCGEISHPQNRAMTNVLTIPLKKWKQLTPDDDAIYIFVDCMNQQQKNMSISHDPHIVIDHHKGNISKSTIAVHDEVGSCSTLVTDLMLSLPPIDAEGGFQFQCFDVSLDGMKEIATALAVGIKTDTLDFRSETTTDDDWRAYKALTRFMSDDKFTRIVNYELPPYMFDYEEIAWRNRQLDPPNFITGIEYVDPTKGDCIPYLADKFMRLTGIQTVVVYGIVGNSIRASVRTVSAALDCGDLCSEIFGEGNGGAKHGIGGAVVTFSFFDIAELNDEAKAALWNLTKAEAFRKFKKSTHK